MINQTNTSALLVYLEGMVDKAMINNNILKPLLFESIAFSDISRLELTVGSRKAVQSWREVEQAILNGYSVLFVEGETSCLLLGTQGWPERSIDEPVTESVVKGSRQSFVESLKQNISMVRRFIPDRAAHRTIFSKQGRREQKHQLLD